MEYWYIVVFPKDDQFVARFIYTLLSLALNISISWKSEIYSVLKRRKWDTEMLGNPLQIPQTGGVHEERSLWVETPFHKVFCKQPEDCKQTLKDIVYSSCYIKKNWHKNRVLSCGIW